MTIRFDSAPGTARDTLKDCSRLLAEQGDADLAALAEEALQGKEDVEDRAHPVFVMSLADASRGHAARAVKPSGWRFLLGRGTHVVAVEVQGDAAGDQHEFTEICDGPLTRGTVAAVELAMADPDLASLDFTVALVRLPALQTQAVWLRAQGEDDRDAPGGRDRFIPIAPTPPTLEPGRVYTQDEFDRQLQEAAAPMRMALDPLDDLLGG